MRYWTFPAFCWSNEVLFRLCVFAGEKFNGGRYCFRVKV